MVDALQEDPRGAWTEIGARIGVSATTARRRWQKINESGQAWIVTHPSAAAGVSISIVELECIPGNVSEVCRAACSIPAVINVHETNGDIDAVLEVLTQDTRHLRATLRQISVITGVARMRSSLSAHVFSDPTRWRTGALSRRPGARQDAAVGTEPASTGRVRKVLGILETDGRASPAEIAEALEISEAHARRYVKSLLRRRVLAQRVDIAPGVSDWPHALALHMRVPAAALTRTAEAISTLPGTRLCVATTGGAHNLFAVIWMHHVRESVDMEARITSAHDVQVLNRSLFLHTHKRVGHMIGADSLHCGHVPWSASLPDDSEA